METGESRRLLVVVELLVSEDSSDARRDFLRDRCRCGVHAGGEGIGAMVKHELGEVLGSGLDAEVPEHGVGFPAPHEGDVVRVDVGAHEGGGTAGAERASADELGFDVCAAGERVGCMAEGVGHEDGLGRAPSLFDGRVCVAVQMERSVGRCVSEEQPPGDLAESFGRAEEGVGVGQVGSPGVGRTYMRILRSYRWASLPGAFAWPDWAQ